MSRPRPTIAVVHNAPVLPADHPDAVSEADVTEVARVVAEALEQGSFEARILPVRPPVESAVAGLVELAPDVVFNLVEGFGGPSRGATLFTALIELTGLPFTGSPVESLALCASKSRTKALLRGFGLPTAPSLLVRPDEAVPAWDQAWPVIVKPDEEDGSLGIEQESLVSDQRALDLRVGIVRSAYGGSVLVESFLPGTEFNIGLLALPEPEVLPISEVVYDMPPGLWPIATYDAKWAIGSAEERGSAVRCPAQVDLALAERLTELAIAAFRVTNSRDYARVDLRLDAHGQPMILEVNPNPDLGPDAGWARSLRRSGRDYAATLVALARQALERGSSDRRG